MPDTAEWPLIHGADDPAHSTTLVRGGRILAGTRDASWWNRPDVRTVKAVHAAVWSSSLGVAAPCDPNWRMLDDNGLTFADQIPPLRRCRRPPCKRLFAAADHDLKASAIAEDGTTLKPEPEDGNDDDS